MIQTEQYIIACDRDIAKNGHLIGHEANPSVAMRDKHAKTLIAYQRALRLCPSMRMRQDSGRLRDKPKPVKKPWEA
jgi:hypothetical protein